MSSRDDFCCQVHQPRILFKRFDEADVAEDLSLLHTPFPIRHVGAFASRERVQGFDSPCPEGDFESRHEEGRATDHGAFGTFQLREMRELEGAASDYIRLRHVVEGEEFLHQQLIVWFEDASGDLVGRRRMLSQIENVHVLCPLALTSCVI